MFYYFSKACLKINVVQHSLFRIRQTKFCGCSDGITILKTGIKVSEEKKNRVFFWRGGGGEASILVQPLDTKQSDLRKNCLHLQGK